MNIEKIEINGHYVEDLSLERLKEVLNYNPDTGIFTWKISIGKSIKPNKIAGGVSSKGYSRIVVDGIRYYTHRLAWFYVYGNLPKNQIDHINHNRSDNSIKNLREVSNEENHKNLSKNKNNTSGFTGVCWCKRTNKWHSKIYVNKKHISLGYFEQKELAIKSRIDAEAKYNYNKNHGK